MHDSTYFDESHLAVREMVRAFAQEHVVPVAAKHDAESSFPWENVKRMAELGLLGIPWGEELGGAGFDTIAFMIAIEELARVDASHSITISAHTTLGTSPIVNFGTDAQKQRYVPLLASGRVLIATHVFLKTSQKTPRSEVEKVIRQKSKLMGYEETMEWKDELP